jgi:uncharacterized protein
MAVPSGIAIALKQAYMIIGVLTLEFRLHGNDSLKGKRQVAQSLKQKLRNTFNVAVSEVDAQDAHQKLVLAVVTVSGETTKVESRLSKALAMVEAISPAELIRADTEVFSSAGEIE